MKNIGDEDMLFKKTEIGTKNTLKHSDDRGLMETYTNSLLLP